SARRGALRTEAAVRPERVPGPWRRTTAGRAGAGVGVRGWIPVRVPRHPAEDVRRDRALPLARLSGHRAVLREARAGGNVLRARTGGGGGRMMEVPVLTGRWVQLEPLQGRHRDGLRAAADDERIWVNTLQNAQGPGFDPWFDYVLAQPPG